MQKSLSHVFVAAAMSAGKSTLINALLGQELLHSANEATTAKITRIYHLEGVQSASASYYANGAVAEACMPVCPDQLQAWNQAEHIAHIDITVPISPRQHKTTLNDYVIFDSPGANNSQNPKHAQVFLDALKNKNISSILYVLNVTQLGTRDDAEILARARQLLPKIKFIFVVNKADQLDEERGETAEHYLNIAQHYLESLGFKHPIILPTMARLALIARKRLNNERLNHWEEMKLTSELERFRANPHRLNDASMIPPQIKETICQHLDQLLHTEVTAENSTASLTEQEVEQFITYTGIRTIEHLICKYPSMNRIYIEHNPFTVETLFKINGQAASELLGIQAYRNQRLQLWVEKIFTELVRCLMVITSFS